MAPLPLKEDLSEEIGPDRLGGCRWNFGFCLLAIPEGLPENCLWFVWPSVVVIGGLRPTASTAEVLTNAYLSGKVKE